MSIGKIVAISMMLLMLAMPIVASAQTDEVDPGVLPSNRVLWALDRLFDNIQHRGDKAAIARERLAELRVEIENNRPEAADRAIDVISGDDIVGEEGDKLATELMKEIDEYNEKFDFDTSLIKDKVNNYLIKNEKIIDREISVMTTGVRKRVFIITPSEDGLIEEIEEITQMEAIDRGLSGKIDLELSHGQIWAALRNDNSFNALARSVVAQTAKNTVTRRGENKNGQRE